MHGLRRSLFIDQLFFEQPSSRKDEVRRCLYFRGQRRSFTLPMRWLRRRAGNKNLAGQRVRLLKCAYLRRERFMPMRIDLPPFGPAQLGHALRMLAACALAYSVSWLFRLPEVYWSLVTVVIVTHPDLPSTVTASRDRIIGTLIGAPAGALAIIGREHGLPTLPLYAVGLVPLVLLTAAWQSLRLSSITFTIVLLAPAGGSSFALPVLRVIEIVIGTLAALVISLVRFPGRLA
jgi:uncharacterized membrane protein YccC